METCLKTLNLLFIFYKQSLSSFLPVCKKYAGTESFSSSNRGSEAWQKTSALDEIIFSEDRRDVKVSSPMKTLLVNLHLVPGYNLGQK